MQNIKQTPGKSPQKTQRRQPRKITERYLHNAGLHYLQRFTASAAHFRKVMMRKIDRSCKIHEDQERDSCVKMLDALVDKFQDLGLLDDESYAQGMVLSLRRKGGSTRAIQARLMKKGLPPDLITESLERYDIAHEGDNELTAALRLVRRRRLGSFGQGREKEKALATLARAGFSYHTACHALDLSVDEAERIIESRS